MRRVGVEEREEWSLTLGVHKGTKKGKIQQIGDKERELMRGQEKALKVRDDRSTLTLRPETFKNK